MIRFVVRKLFVHFIVKRFMDTFIKLFKLGYLSTAWLSEWAIFTVSFAAAIGLILVTFTDG